MQKPRTTPKVITILEIDKIHCGECLELMKEIPDNYINLIYTDPPYFKVKGDLCWDNQWENPAKFIDWIGELCQEWQRILKPNGSLYVFASPKMAARVECKIGEYFNVLNRITWRKNDGTANEGGLWSRANKDILRTFFEQKEELIFAEHFGSDNIAKGEAGYGAKCDEMRGFVFEPIRAYLESERQKSGISRKDLNFMFSDYTDKKGCRDRSVIEHYFGYSQWCLPTEEIYKNILQKTGFFKREYEDLKREYEDLKREYEDRRRPFRVTSEVPYTDVWDFPTVQYYEGKHPCEKPIEMSRHVIAASSRPGDVVLDCFGGSCHVADACIQLGRKYIIIEQNAEYCRQARKRVSMIQPEAAQKRVAAMPARLDRWAEAEG